uniref:Uncharacterized protein n=1 Tax=Glossina palpalis gambiensis TaxID=67801 RepID=A0A1B0C6A9_9MUSC
MRRFIPVEPIEEDDKVKAEICKILTAEHIKEYVKAEEFEEKFSGPCHLSPNRNRPSLLAAFEDENGKIVFSKIDFAQKRKQSHKNPREILNELKETDKKINELKEQGESVTSRQHEPIHMCDAFTGKLRCTYRGYDEVDEVEHAISLLFSNDGQKVMVGCKKSIQIFDPNICNIHCSPGRKCSNIAVKQTGSCFAAYRRYCMVALFSNKR